MPSYEGSFKTMQVVASYGLDVLEFTLLYVLPVVALVTAAFIVQRLLLLRGGRGAGWVGRWPALHAADYSVEGAELADRGPGHAELADDAPSS